MPDNRTRMQRTKGYDPEPMDLPPLFQSPSRPVAMLRWLVTSFLWPQTLAWIGIAALVMLAVFFVVANTIRLAIAGRKAPPAR